MQREFDGRGLKLRRELVSTEAYRQYNVTYRSGDLRISGVLNVPRGARPVPDARARPRLHRPGHLRERPGDATRAGLARPPGLRDPARRLPQPRRLRRRPGGRDEPATRLHRGRHQRRARPARLGRTGRRRARRTRGPVDGRRRDLQRAHGPARPGRRGGRVRAGQLQHRGQLRALDPPRPGPGRTSRGGSSASTASPTRTRSSGATSARGRTSTASPSRSSSTTGRQTTAARSAGAAAPRRSWKMPAPTSRCGSTAARSTPSGRSGQRRCAAPTRFLRSQLD